MSNPKSASRSPSTASSSATILTPSETLTPSRSTTAGTTTTTTATTTASSIISPQKPSTSARQSKRPLAKRSCLSCRQKKARCELPDLFVPSSQDPVIKSKRCHRCSALDIDCIVWDGARKRKPKLPPRNENDQSNQNITFDKSTLETSWSPLTHLASAAEAVARLSTFSSWSASPVSSPRPEAVAPQLSKPSESSTFSSLIAHLPHSKTHSPALLSDPFFHIPPEIFTQSSLEPHTSSIGKTANTEKTGDHYPTPDVQSSRNIQRDELGSEDGGDSGPPNQRSASTPISDRFSTSAEKEATTFQKSQDRTWRSVWRPISVLVDYAAHQPQFTVYLAQRVLLPNPSLKAMDLLELIDREECRKLAAW